ncbi:LysR family transcriptional regulator [Sulfitobacter geojensis]|uniref:LysR family transcriptional regulator n=1 Tax=Sulfitobacter geojensis TaxID=1342299 RepID=A0AAE2W172_9RHOB|nr:LysR family transcriptional regulator [Sulfitobacter geojensis]MBM1690710.1 LysR family transcriptional regulator [Sulfitobacter geojensis]MBM1694776.1 LysR family transcriptional regulator [Sulfitobacter geojensis]MBM1707069.1 LysR family transcriptional regulator [Sulfitobacter geojensis]MBM1711128.1 LysR family transcriptional regulator [Sulfitobacter geojensis]MBM1715194.1 LysR family transcriptional regulator [Sulfitobacter geojensis]
MDITLIKTFIEVANTGSFVAACDRLFVTQSAVSLRVQRLEDSLGHPLFIRSKAGAVLTPEGKQFERYALSLLKIWEEAKQQISIPEGYSRALSIGAQYSLWPRLGFRWMDAMQLEMPELSVHCELGMSDRIMRFLVEGVIHAALLYTPQLRPGLIAEPALDDELVLVASYPDATLDLKDTYVAVDWGPEFTHALTIALPHLTDAGRSMALGALAMEYIVNRRAAAYLPARTAKRHLDAGKLHIVADAPRFPYPSWVIWRNDIDEDLAALARRTLANVVQGAEKEQEFVTKRLEAMDAYGPG